ncbi:MAG: ComEC/Rec2 family competence protein [Thermomicrobiales bacterium]
MTGIAAGLAALAAVAFGLWGVIAFAAGAIAIMAVRRIPPSVASVIVVVFAAALGLWRQPDPAAHGGTLAPAPLELSALTVVTSPVGGGGYRQFVAADTADPVQRVCVTARSLPQVAAGDQIAVTGRVRLARDEAVRVRRFLMSRGCAGSVFAESLRVVATGEPSGWLFPRARDAMSGVLRRLSPGDSGALLAGLVVGDDSALSSAREEAFTNSGTTHLTAVSGSNIALVAGMLIALGRASIGQHRLPWQIVTIAGIWAFAFVSGGEPPALRAAVAASVALLAVRFGRRADFVTLIVLAAAALALWDPVHVDRLGFQLSVAAALALAVVMPAFAEGGPASVVVGLLAATAVAQIATLPMLLAVFGTVSVLSIPANLIVAPLAGVIMPWAGFAGLVGVVSPRLGEALVAPAALGADGVIAAAGVFGGPGTQIQLGMPPAESTLVLGVTCAALVVVMATRGRDGV